MTCPNCNNVDTFEEAVSEEQEAILVCNVCGRERRLMAEDANETFHWDGDDVA
jgi:transcription elongation factor Elf1